MSALRWGLVGASDIAATRMIPAMRRLGHEVAVVYSSSAERAAGYAAIHGIPQRTSSLEALLARDDIDAVYISTTNHLHCPQTLAAAAAFADHAIRPSVQPPDAGSHHLSSRFDSHPFRE